MNLNLKNEVTYCYRPTGFAQALLILLRNCIGFGNGSPNEKGDQGRLFLSVAVLHGGSAQRRHKRRRPDEQPGKCPVHAFLLFWCA
jgi:hypothetical protein